MAADRYLDDPVLPPQPGQVGRRSRVEGADVLSGSQAGAVQVEAVAFLRPDHVAQARGRRRRLDFGSGDVLTLDFALSRSLLEDEIQTKQV